MPAQTPLKKALIITSFILSAASIFLCFLSEHFYNVSINVTLSIFYSTFAYFARHRRGLILLAFIELAIFTLVLCMVGAVFIDGEAMKVGQFEEWVLFGSFAGLIFHFSLFCANGVDDDEEEPHIEERYQRLVHFTPIEPTIANEYAGPMF
ncbi:hypothetical protein GCK72_009024 [Caenorhabditis remanei]|uniref:Uncharacterized protein n=1 Tax=Caenorhabditis remanei TaxID=31234 RepID=A0A6A5H1W5_CAERE|nr:hypothetical protein GCK72_009024 [Caenorhabditis remanei]KAF1760774.1 hypothetical protein GCK72_009024 [Caenorhabditis remanei]